VGGSCEAADSQSDIKQICRKTPDFIKVIPATPEPKITESGPEPEFRPEFRRNFEPRRPGRGKDGYKLKASELRDRPFIFWRWETEEWIDLGQEDYEKVSGEKAQAPDWCGRLIG
jgi:hypothetical protein